MIHRRTLSLLVEGGLGGHMSHLHEDSSLTFGEIKNIFRQLASRKNTIPVVEKVDGQNIFFTCIAKTKEVRFARNRSHIASGGFGRNEIISRWAELPKVQAAYLDAYDVLQKTLSKLNKNVLASVFGENGDLWFSAEVISEANPNVLNYDGNHLVLHNAVIRKNDDGTFSDEPSAAIYSSIVQMIGNTQLSISKRNWQIHGQLMRKLLGVQDHKEFAKGFDILNFLQAKYGLSDKSTISDMVLGAVQNAIPEISAWPEEAIKWLAKTDEKIDLRKQRIQKILQNNDIVLGKTPSERNRMLSSLIARANNAGTKSMQNLGQALETLMTQVMRDFHSLLIANPKEEAKRLRQEVQKIEGEMHTAGLSFDSITKLEDRLRRLGGVEAIQNAVEGVVIRWKGKTYKLTYPFGYVNQILGLFRYGN